MSQKETVLSRTQSVCPHCLKRINARYAVIDDRIYLKKTCAKHGDFSVLVWEGVTHWQNWQRRPANNQPPVCDQRVVLGCPYDCGLCSEHRQLTCCVLLEVTGQCNMNCPVCFASSGSQRQQDPDIQVIENWYDMLLRCGGPFNIQLSGGEPTMRDDLPDIIALGRRKGFSFFQLNTNGLRLAVDFDYLQSMQQAGLNTVFLQFDGIDSDSSRYLRGQDYTKQKLKAVENCQKAQVGVVLVPTVKKGVNDQQLGNILEFAEQHMPTIRGVHFQPMSYFGRYDELPDDNDRLTIPALLQMLEQQSGKKLCAGDFSPGNAEHALCSFHADYTIRGGKWQIKKSTAACGCGSSAKSREVVARQWSAANTDSYCGAPAQNYNTASLDDFLDDLARHSMAISGMAFQDAWNLDLERLKRCYIHEVSPAKRLIPFCAYNLTAVSGEPLYRMRSEEDYHA